MIALIACEGLRFAYGGREVLHGVSFTVEQGGIVGLLGKNGAGKSTTINILMGFLRPDAGACSILGHPGHAIPPLERRRIGLLHEGFVQYDFMTIAEIERYHAAFYPAWDRDLYYDLVNRLVDVPHSRKVSRLSCGQRSQVILGLILAQCPELMILDDYSMGLDVGYRRLFLEFLREYVDVRGTTVLLTSHIVQELDSFLDDVLIIHEGEIIVSGTRDSFMAGFFGYTLPARYEPRLRELAPTQTRGGPVHSIEAGRRDVAVYGFAPLDAMRGHLAGLGLETEALDQLAQQPLSFEDAFIGLTGRY
ncbi:MAG: ABC transporter ATP-binding protein [Desulfovibrio sp.]|jgi:ABC-2 type transport system ATP-binding protein|nr:ABC transporter ATP-binding protein [Desulfovibrio sp.]